MRPALREPSAPVVDWQGDQLEAFRFAGNNFRTVCRQSSLILNVASGACCLATAVDPHCFSLLYARQLTGGGSVQGVAYYERAGALFQALGNRGGLVSSLMMCSTRGADYLGRTAVPAPSRLSDRLRDDEEALQKLVDRQAELHG